MNRKAEVFVRDLEGKLNLMTWKLDIPFEDQVCIPGTNEKYERKRQQEQFALIFAGKRINAQLTPGFFHIQNDSQILMAALPSKFHRRKIVLLISLKGKNKIAALLGGEFAPLRLVASYL